MKKIILTVLTLLFTISLTAFGDFIKGADYNIDYKRKVAGMADTIHINFFTAKPSPATAEKIVMSHLREYGQRTKGKNIIGSAWFSPNGESGSFSKIRFTDTSASYVWINRTNRIVTFSAYVSYLKREKERRRIAVRNKNKS
ncbi:MAG: hypothetical protein LBT79_02850 [Elusimicrobiota bacterium]|jgi:hypothetical protein|nr:hypothetical protein [Elusimicrobiota bacterium]